MPRKQEIKDGYVHNLIPDEENVWGRFAHADVERFTQRKFRDKDFLRVISGIKNDDKVYSLAMRYKLLMYIFTPGSESYCDPVASLIRLYNEHGYRIMTDKDSYINYDVVMRVLMSGWFQKLLKDLMGESMKTMKDFFEEKGITYGKIIDNLVRISESEDKDRLPATVKLFDMMKEADKDHERETFMLQENKVKAIASPKQKMVGDFVGGSLAILDDENFADAIEISYSNQLIEN